jgi:hypothetical protein
MTCPTCSYYSSHGCVLGLVQPCSRYSPGVETLETWLRCECGGWVEIRKDILGPDFRAFCTRQGCTMKVGRAADPAAALVAFHEGRKECPYDTCPMLS